jgi:hypothetical protein
MRHGKKEKLHGVKEKLHRIRHMPQKGISGRISSRVISALLMRQYELKHIVPPPGITQHTLAGGTICFNVKCHFDASTSSSKRISCSEFSF